MSGFMKARNACLATVMILAMAGGAHGQGLQDNPYLPKGQFTQVTTEVIGKAVKGDAQSQFLLGRMLEDNMSDIPSDPSAAVYWYRLAAKQNMGQAQAELAVSHIQGRFAARDYVIAQMLLLLAKKNGYGDVLIDGVEMAHEFLAEKLTAEEKKQSEAMAAAWKPGDDIPYIAPDSVAAKQLITLREKASAGDAKAQFVLGEAYEEGKLVPRDQAVADDFYRKAAANGNAEAKDRLSPEFAAYVAGFKAFEADDDATALKIWRPCAEAGGPRCQFGMGRLMVVQKKFPEAAEWYRKSAEQGFSRAQNDLGMMYYEGNGVQENEAEAEKWMRKAADQGHVSAQFNLGTFYRNRAKTPANEQQARYWLQKAADQGHGTAQMLLRIEQGKN